MEFKKESEKPKKTIRYQTKSLIRKNENGQSFEAETAFSNNHPMRNDYYVTL